MGWLQMFVPSGDGVNGPKSMGKKDQAKEQVLQQVDVLDNVKRVLIVLLEFHIVQNLVFAMEVDFPFDEAQLEIVGDEEAQGFINNNPRKNSPIHKKSGSSNNGGAAPRRNGGNGRKNAGNGRKNAGNGRKNNQSQARKQPNQQRRKPSNNSNTKTSASNGRTECPGGSVDACIDQACVPLENVNIYAA